MTREQQIQEAALNTYPDKDRGEGLPRLSHATSRFKFFMGAHWADANPPASAPAEKGWSEEEVAKLLEWANDSHTWEPVYEQWFPNEGYGEKEMIKTTAELIAAYKAQNPMI